MLLGPVLAEKISGFGKRWTNKITDIAVFRFDSDPPIVPASLDSGDAADGAYLVGMRTGGIIALNLSRWRHRPKRKL